MRQLEGRVRQRNHERPSQIDQTTCLLREPQALPRSFNLVNLTTTELE
jgi:hypothetical protein